jgi:hypothetical protein
MPSGSNDMRLKRPPVKKDGRVASVQELQKKHGRTVGLARFQFLRLVLATVEIKKSGLIGMPDSPHVEIAVRI